MNVNSNKKGIKPYPNDDFLNSLLAEGQPRLTGSNFMKSSSNKPNSRQVSQAQRIAESFDISSRNNIEKAMHAYNSTTNKKEMPNHKRSSSYQIQSSNSKKQPDQFQSFQVPPQQQDRVQSRQQHKRPKSNLDVERDESGKTGDIGDLGQKDVLN